MNVSAAGCGPSDFKVVAIVNAPVSKLYANLGCLEMLPCLRNPTLDAIERVKKYPEFLCWSSGKGCVFSVQWKEHLQILCKVLDCGRE